MIQDPVPLVKSPLHVLFQSPSQPSHRKPREFHHFCPSSHAARLVPGIKKARKSCHPGSRKTHLHQLQSSASCKRGSAPASDQLRSRRERLQPIPLHCRHRPYRHPAIQLPFRAISKRTARLNPTMPPHSMQRYLIRLEPVNKKLKPNLSPRSRLNRRPLPLILHNMQAIDVTQCRRQLNQKSCKESHRLRALSPRG